MTRRQALWNLIRAPEVGCVALRRERARKHSHSACTNWLRPGGSGRKRPWGWLCWGRVSLSWERGVSELGRSRPACETHLCDISMSCWTLALLRLLRTSAFYFSHRCSLLKQFLWFFIDHFCLWNNSSINNNFNLWVVIRCQAVCSNMLSFIGLQFSCLSGEEDADPQGYSEVTQRQTMEHTFQVQVKRQYLEWWKVFVNHISDLKNYIQLY